MEFPNTIRVPFVLRLPIIGPMIEVWLNKKRITRLENLIFRQHSYFIQINPDYFNHFKTFAQIENLFCGDYAGKHVKGKNAEYEAQLNKMFSLFWDISTLRGRNDYLKQYKFVKEAINKLVEYPPDEKNLWKRIYPDNLLFQFYPNEALAAMEKKSLLNSFGETLLLSHRGLSYLQEKLIIHNRDVSQINSSRRQTVITFLALLVAILALLKDIIKEVLSQNIP